MWKPIESVPQHGEFLIGVWEGTWNEPRKEFKVYEASGFPSGPVWVNYSRYRTAEGEAYEVVAWMQKPELPVFATSSLQKV